MKKAIVMFSAMGLLFSGCEAEGHKEHKEGEKKGEVRTETSVKPANGQVNGQVKVQTPGMEK